ncbi:MAG: nuclear transport factor 2 family protein [Phycisphaerales bacterium]|jgi:putative hydrolase of HD superfamily|nr:nuclear transport factor 2 family protein [Phycisphaerales bacterium]
MPRSPIATVQAQLEAYNARNIDAFLATFAHDAQVIDQDTGELRCQGHDAIRARYGAQFIEHPHQRSHVISRHAVGTFVADLEYITGNTSRPDVHLIATYRVRQGLIDRMWLTPRLDSPAMREHEHPLTNSPTR